MPTSEMSHHELLGRFDQDRNDTKRIEVVTQTVVDLSESDSDIDSESEFDAFMTTWPNNNLVKEALLEAPGSVPAEDVSVDDVAVSGVPTWSNCIGKQTCHPKEIRDVKGLQDLITAVNDAKDKKLPLRAVGSGHSFSDVCPTDGILLTTGNMKASLPFDYSILNDPMPKDTYKYVSVESGMTVKALNALLDGQGLALETMGAYDGQTLAGAISTGTHGSGQKLGPIASLVCSIVLVSETGKVYQIEPSNGITNPAKFQPRKFNIELKQNDDWFRSTLVAMGCMGLIYSYTFRVVQSFLLSETRKVTTWQELKPQLSKSLSSDLLAHRYFEVDINPYPTGKKNPQNVAVTVVRDIPPRGTPISRRGRSPADWLLGAIAQYPGGQAALAIYLNLRPQKSPGIIAGGLKALKDFEWVNKSYVVLNVGKVNDARGYAVELSFNAEHDIVGIVDRIITTFQTAATEKKLYLAGPFSLRFVDNASAYVAPQQGRVTMMVEMVTMDGIRTADTLLRHMKESLCSGPEGGDVRVHWGLDLCTVTKEEVARMYPEWNRWVAVYKELNSSGVWNNAFTKRLGISM